MTRSNRTKNEHGTECRTKKRRNLQYYEQKVLWSEWVPFVPMIKPSHQQYTECVPEAVSQNIW